MRACPSWLFLLYCFCSISPGVATATGPVAAPIAQCDSLLAAAQFVEAAQCALQLLEEIDARGDGESPIAVEILTLLVRAELNRGGRIDASTSAFADRLLALTRTRPGSADSDLAMSLRLMGTVHERAGEFALARAAYQEALERRDAAGTPDDVELARCLLFLANVKSRLGDLAAVDELYERAQEVAAVVAGPGSPLLAGALANYAIYKKLTGDLPGARELYDRTLRIQIGLHGESHRDVARTYYNLGILLVEMGDYAGARTFYLKSLAIRELVAGPESSDVARSLTALALTERQGANLLSARRYAERAVEIQQALVPPLHPQMADVLAVLAVIQSDLGDLEAARQTLEQVLSVYEKALGPDHVRVGEVIAELGMLSQLAGDLQGALVSYRRARAIYEAADGENDEVAGVLNVEAMLLADMGRAPEGRPLVARSLALREQRLGSTHPMVGWALASLGRCCWQEGAYARADSLLSRSLEILGAFPEKHDPVYLSAMFDLARAKRSRGAVSDALALTLAVERGRRESLRLTLRGLPERLALIHADRWPNGLNLAVTIATDTTLSPGAVAAIWSELIGSRALVLDEMAWRRRTAVVSGDAEADSLQEALGATTRELARLLVGSRQNEVNADSLNPARDLSRRREQIEERLGFLFPGRADSARTLQVTLAAIDNARSARTALVGFVRFDRHRREVVAGSPDDVVTDAATERRRFVQARYAAFVLPAGVHDPVVVDLGAATEIDGLVRVWRDEAGSGNQVPGRDAAAAVDACRRAGAALRERIWDPLLPYLEGANRVDLVPDGNLHLVNFAALPIDGDRYLIDLDRPICTIDLERDLVNRPAVRDVSGGLLAFGAPDFSSGAVPFELSPLPGSAAEVDEIADLWRRSQAGPNDVTAVLTLFGDDASEAAFKTLAPGFRALHVATHGFFLGDRTSGPASGWRGVGGLKAQGTPAVPADDEANPMFRSGLVLTRSGDAVNGTGEDGILTAAEIAELDLGGVDWVVLSTCDSGVGETRTGEGVFGLRRAFRIAGARNLVTSLWSLPDDVIRDWMLELYKAHLVERLDLVSASWTASRAILATRRAAGLDTHPQTWAGFIATGD